MRIKCQSFQYDEAFREGEETRIASNNLLLNRFIDSVVEIKNFLRIHKQINL